VLRFLPTDSKEFLSRLYFNQAVHERLEAVGIKIISSFAFDPAQYQTQLSGLASLAHVSALIVEAIGIALTVYIITRWI
jgi:hypothetical protein